MSRLAVQAVAVEDGEAALGAILEDPLLDLAFVDLSMPRLDGLGLARAVRALEAETGRRPLFLVALTGGDDPRAALAAGFDRFQQKPLSLDGLREALAEARLRDEPSAD